MRRAGLILIATVALVSPASAEVTVRYATPREVSDFYFRSASERDALYRELAGTLRRMGEQLPPGRSLKVELSDVRPAGRFNPVYDSTRPRMLNGATPPSLKLRYALSERGRTIARGEETVTDLNYLENISARTSLSSFPYERELIRDWFRDRILRGRPPLR